VERSRSDHQFRSYPAGCGYAGVDPARARSGVIRGKGLYWFAVYLAWIGIQLWSRSPGASGNLLNPLSIVLLGFATVGIAFSARTLSSRLLRGNDISYGVYIYHMPIVNLLIVLGVTEVAGALAAVAATVCCAWLSWRLVEKPALRLKGYSARW
jgi:peptidoglycan/LPS O-acetylase OafA/YrhL